MRLLITLIIVCLISNLNALSQNNNDPVFLTKKQNDIWIKTLESKFDINEKLDFIKRKILQDSILTDTKLSDISTYVWENNETANESIERHLKEGNFNCKIIFLLIVKNKSFFLDIRKNPKSKRILSLLDPTELKNISLIQGFDALIIYPEERGCPVVILKSDSRKLKKRIKNVL